MSAVQSCAECGAVFFTTDLETHMARWHSGVKPPSTPLQDVGWLKLELEAALEAARIEGADQGWKDALTAVSREIMMAEVKVIKSGAGSTEIYWFKEALSTIGIKARQLKEGGWRP